jgi:hypothetical protein
MMLSRNRRALLAGIALLAPRGKARCGSAPLSRTRTHPVAFFEKRNRLIGPGFSLSVRGNF